MSSYIKNAKYKLIYSFIICMCIPFVFAGLQMQIINWIEGIGYLIVLLIMPYAITSFFYELFVMDVIEKKDIVCEINKYLGAKNILILLFGFLYLISVILHLSRETNIISLSFLLLIIFLIQQRVILTKDKLYCRFNYLDLNLIEQVIFIKPDQYRVVTIEGKSFDYCFKGAKEIFKHINKE